MHTCTEIARFPQPVRVSLGLSSCRHTCSQCAGSLSHLSRWRRGACHRQAGRQRWFITHPDFDWLFPIISISSAEHVAACLQTLAISWGSALHVLESGGRCRGNRILLLQLWQKGKMAVALAYGAVRFFSWWTCGESLYIPDSSYEWLTGSSAQHVDTMMMMVVMVIMVEMMMMMRMMMMISIPTFSYLILSLFFLPLQYT